MDVFDTVLNYNSNKNIGMFNALNQCDDLLGAFRNSRSILTRIQIGFFIGYQSFLIGAYSLYGIGKKLGFRWNDKKDFFKQINADIKLLGEKDKQVDDLARQIVKENSLFAKYDEKQVEMAVKVAKATYATTTKFYAPVVEAWARSLLIRAKRENLQLVFLARDGNAPLEVAKKLQEANPSFSDIPLRNIYFSRKVIENSSQEVLRKYLQQESVIDPSKEVRKQLFIDIGFFGSMIAKIRKAVGSPVPFEFLVSTSDRAHGFAGNLKSVLPSVTCAGKNRGVYWMEATHQGVIDSPSKLIECKDGTLQPNSVLEDKTCRARSEVDFLCKKIAWQALFDAVHVDQKIEDDKDKSYELVDEKIKNDLDKFLADVKRNRFLYVNNE